MRPISLLYMLLLLSAAFASSIAPAPILSAPYCNGTISQYVPAVVGTGGGLVNVTLELIPSRDGNGIVYAGVYPTLGVSTQESIVNFFSLMKVYAFFEKVLYSENEFLIFIISGSRS